MNLPLMSQRKLAAPEPSPLGAAAIGPRGCRFIAGDPRERGWNWCGEPTEAGSSWCRSHHRRVFKPRDSEVEP